MKCGRQSKSHSKCKEVLGPKKQKNKELISSETFKKIKERKRKRQKLTTAIHEG